MWKRPLTWARQGRRLPVGRVQINSDMSTKTTIKKVVLNPKRLFIAFSQVKMKSLNLNSVDIRIKLSHWKPSRNYYFREILPFKHTTSIINALLLPWLCIHCTTFCLTDPENRWKQNILVPIQESASDRSKEACKKWFQWLTVRIYILNTYL